MARDDSKEKTNGEDQQKPHLHAPSILAQTQLELRTASGPRKERERERTSSQERGKDSSALLNVVIVESDALSEQKSVPITNEVAACSLTRPKAHVSAQASAARDGDARCPKHET